VRLAQYEEVYESRVVTGEISGSNVFRVLLQPGDISVFASSSSSISLFDTRTVLRVLRFYADVRALQGHALVRRQRIDGRRLGGTRSVWRRLIRWSIPRYRRP
jgi:hypothetical protein